VPTAEPRSVFAAAEPSPAVAKLNQLYTLTAPPDYAALREALADDDPFLRNAAVTVLAQPQFRNAVTSDLDHANPRVRLGALLALRRADVPNPEALIKTRLRDSNPDVVQTAMIWTGEKVLTSLAADVDAAASSPTLSKRLFETWLATMQILQHQGLKELYATRTAPNAINRDLSPAFIERLAMDPQRPAVLRALALRWMTDVDQSSHFSELLQLARKSDPTLQLEALRRLATSSRPESTETLRAIARDTAQPSTARAEALTSLASRADDSIVPLLDDPVPAVRLEAARALRGAVKQPDVRAALVKKLEATRGDASAVKLANQLEFLLGSESGRPDGVEGWQNLLASGGDVEAGRRVFFSSNSACNSCHVAEGRGGVLGTGFSTMPFGPDLSVIGRTANRRQIIESIVAPSMNVAPEMQGWMVRKKSGEVLTGRQIDQEARNIQLILLDGKEHNIPRTEIASWGAMDVSLMPVGLPSGMSKEEFRDLVAYLESLK
jgi:putative heme-binding domain-containing protein